MNRSWHGLAIVSGFVLLLVSARLQSTLGLALGQSQQVVDGGRVPRGGIILSRSPNSWPGYAFEDELSLTSGWRDVRPMPTRRAAAGSVLLGDRLFVVGGWNSDIFVEANEEYDAAADTWTSRAPLPVGQNHVSLVEYGGLLYALGSAEGPEKYRYDPVANSWQGITPMLSYRSYAPACLAGDRIYVCGGWQ